MATLKINGDTSGYVELVSPAVAGSTSIELDKILVSDSSGNVGIGRTPESHYTGYTALDLGHSSSLFGNKTGSDTNVVTLANNGYLNSTASAWKYIVTDEATKYEQSNGKHRWFHASSGTAGTDVTWTNSMAIDASGNVGIGEINPVTPLHVSKDGNGIVTIERSNKTSGSGYFGINVEANSQATLAYDDGGSFVIGRSSDPSTQAGFSNDFIMDSLGRTGLGIIPNFTPGGSRRMLQIGNGASGALIALGTSANESPNPRIFSNQYTLGLAAGITTGELQFYTNDVERITVEAGGTIQMGGGDSASNPPIIMGGNNFSVYMGATNTNTINVGYNENQTYNLHINYKGYQSGTTQFRNLVVNDGKSADIARFKGEHKLLELPGAPSFRARVNQGFSGNNTTIVFADVQHNIGNHYNNSNGRFTAPVSGSYFFGYQGISGSSTTSNEQNMSLVINNTTGICDARSRGYTEGSLHLKTVVYLTAGDYVTVKIGNGNTSTYAAGFHNQFFGHFIG